MNSPDMLEVVNGPEDGTEFPISRAPLTLGSAPGCAVNVRLDETVQPFHARLTAVDDGYRVRKLNTGSLTVDGRRAGIVRSRILRDGGILRAGSTELCLRRAPRGLASRSRGLAAESDIVWCFRLIGRRFFTALRWLAHLARRRRIRFMLFVAAMFIMIRVVGLVEPGYWTGFEVDVRELGRTVLDRIRAIIAGMN